MYTYIYIYMYIFTCVYMCVYIYICVYVCLCLSVYTYEARSTTFNFSFLFDRTVCELLSFRLKEEGILVADAYAEKLKPKERDALLKSFSSGRFVVYLPPPFFLYKLDS